MAVENCKVLSFPKNSVLGIMQKNTKFAENLLQLLSQKIVILNRKINLIELDSIRRKVCKILLDNYKKNNTYSYKISSKKELAEEFRYSKAFTIKRVNKYEGFRINRF